MPSKLSRLVVATFVRVSVCATESGSLLMCAAPYRLCSGITLTSLCEGTSFMSRNAWVVVTCVDRITVGFLCTGTSWENEVLARQATPVSAAKKLNALNRCFMCDNLLGFFDSTSIASCEFRERLVGFQR